MKKSINYIYNYLNKHDRFKENHDFIHHNYTNDDKLLKNCLFDCVKNGDLKGKR